MGCMTYVPINLALLSSEATNMQVSRPSFAPGVVFVALNRQSHSPIKMDDAMAAI